MSWFFLLWLKHLCTANNLKSLIYNGSLRHLIYKVFYLCSWCLKLYIFLNECLCPSPVSFFSLLSSFALYRMVQIWRTRGSCPSWGSNALKDPFFHETPFILLFPFFNEIYRLIWVISNKLMHTGKQPAEKDYGYFFLLLSLCLSFFLFLFFCKKHEGKKETSALKSTRQTVRQFLCFFSLPFFLCGCRCSCWNLAMEQCTPISVVVPFSKRLRTGDSGLVTVS